MILQIAFRNFTRNGRRFLLLGIAVSAGFFFVSTLQSLVSGLSNQINTRGARFYGGHVIIKKDMQTSAPSEENALIVTALEKAGVHPAVLSHRTHFGNYEGADGVAYYHGEAVRVRRTIGMDWSEEGPKIGQMKFVAGDPGGMSDPDGALISDVMARRLGASVGDQITLQVIRQGGAINTVPVRVKAVFHEVSIFGYYTVYVDRHLLDRALGLDPDYTAMVGLYLKDYRQADRVAARLQSVLGTAYTVSTVVDLMPEIRTMLQALTLVSYGVLILLSVVIAVGILNMYRVIIYERTREIGTMRAIGVQKPQVRNIVLCEAFFLSMCGIAAGLIVSLLALVVLARIPVSSSAGFDIFLEQGHLSWVLYPDVVGLDAFLVVLTTLLGTIGPARAAQAIDPVVALRAE
jgi:putative ABC transport system permease protein